MSTQSSSASEDNTIFTTSQEINHKDSVSLDGLDHIFKWASEVVSEGEDTTVRLARERKIRREVLDVVSKYQQERSAAKNREEIAYLQRRVIALLQKVQELTEDNAAVKQIMVSQYFCLQRIPQLEAEIKELKIVEFEREAAVTERRYLMDALSKLKVERDFLEDTLISAENENGRLAKLLKDSKAELEEIKARKWWHFLLKWFKSSEGAGEATPSELSA